MAWLRSKSPLSGRFSEDAVAFSKLWGLGAAVRQKLPQKSKRNAAQATAVAAILRLERQAREDFLGAHIDTLYRKLTDEYHKFERVETLIYSAGKMIAGLVPTPAEIERENQLVQKEKDGLEIDQGVLLAHLCAPAALGPPPTSNEEIEHLREVRDWLRSKPEAERQREIYKAAERGDRAVLRAVLRAPTPALIDMNMISLRTLLMRATRAWCRIKRRRTRAPERRFPSPRALWTAQLG